MSDIDANMVRRLARVWHRFDPTGQDLEELAEMLKPMDDAGEALSANIEFDMEPAGYLAGLEAMADEEPRS